MCQTDKSQNVDSCLDERFQDRSELDCLELAASIGMLCTWEWFVETGDFICHANSCQLFGIDETEWNGTYDAWIKMVHPDDQVLVKQYLQNVLDGANPVSLEFRMRSAAGSVQHVKSVAQVRLDEFGLAKSVVGVSCNITEQKRMQLELLEAREQAEASNRAKSAFLVSMSHEIRTPMNAIIGFSHLCAETGVTPKQLDYLKKIQSSAHALLGIIDDILDYSRLESERMEIEHVSFELYSVLSNLIAVVGAKVREKKLDLLFDIAPDVPLNLISDPTRLAQVLVHLVDNAIKFTLQGEVVLSFSFQDEADSCRLHVTVKDTGIGMTEAQLADLFNVFFQADSGHSRRYAGTGLGLAICHKLVALMGGDISVSSIIGQGSVFEFSIPIVKGKSLMSNTSVQSQEVQTISVLMIENHPSSSSVMANYLQSHGFDVYVVADVAGALAMLQNNRYQLLMLDWEHIQSERMDLLAQLQSVKSRVSYVLVNSTCVDDELKMCVSQEWVDAILNKPLLPNVLANQIHELMLGRRLTCVSELSRQRQLEQLRGRRILLAEDEPFNQLLACDLLEPLGVILEIANNGREALDLLAQRAFDCVLMDMEMPVMNGVSATEVIRNNPKFNRLPIIALTANVELSDRQLCLRVGMNDFLSKPLDPSDLFKCLLKWITQMTSSVAQRAVVGLKLPVTQTSFATLIAAVEDTSVLVVLLQQMQQQLQVFDSSVEQSLAQLETMIGHDIAAVLAPLEQAITNYDYEYASKILDDWLVQLK